ncbi:hypothetical protein HAX54_024984 [Datura stramonium]|uniref:Protein kinase domain-containing protein n=1 Tax=Datura stramonium TaxID=4076 RepID=A0ABS8UYP2_DATST|nr:hypothetical protein [Datura stramonium]
MHHFTRKKLSSSSASAERLKKEQDYYYLKNGSSVLEELLALCDGNCRIPIRYFSGTEIDRATDHSAKNIELADARASMFTDSLDNRLVLIRFSHHFYGVHRDIAVTSQMSHLKNVLRLVGCCLEFEKPVMVYEYVEAINLDELLFNKARKSLLSWGSRLRIAKEVASAVVFPHTEFTTPIIHRTICPSNVIIDQNNGVAKLVDFSLSLSLPPGKLEVQDLLAGRIGYVDHEYFRTRKILLLMDHVMDIADPAILEEHRIEIRQQLEDYLDLVKICTLSKGEDRPYMIHVARELRQIEKCFRALSVVAHEN